MDRGKVLSDRRPRARCGFARYKDVDGDGIRYRTLPGTDTRGRRTSPAAPATTTRPRIGAAGRLEEQHGPAGAQVRDGARPVPKPILEAGGRGRGRHHRLRLADPAVVEAASLLDRTSRFKTTTCASGRCRSARDQGVHRAPRAPTWSSRTATPSAPDPPAAVPHCTTTIQSVLHYDGFPLDARSVIEQAWPPTAKENAKS